MVAGFLLAREVSDLCIGKPPIRWLPPSSTVAHAVAELEADGGPGAAVAVWDGQEGAAVVGRVRMADVLLFLCADDGNNLQATLADLLAAAGAPPVRARREVGGAHASLPWTSTCIVLEAVDVLLGGAQSLVVPIRDNRHRRRPETTHQEAESMCWVTVEDVVRFFLGSVALFSHIALRSVSDLGAVRPVRSALAVAPGHDALSAVEPLLRTALATHASVAVVSGRCLVGEISPSALCSLDASVAAHSAGSLVSSVHRGRAQHSAALRLRNLLHPLSRSSSSSSSPSSSSASSSSSEDEDEERNGTPAYRSQGGKHGSSYSARWTKGREPIACRRGSSLVAVMAQAVAHRVTQVWVLDDEPEEEELVGVVGLLDVLRVLRRHLLRAPPAHSMAE